MAPKLIQLEDILRTYVMYNFDLGMWWELWMPCVNTTADKYQPFCSDVWDLRGK